MKSFGDKTASLFSKKKDEAEKIGQEKVNNAQKMAEEQATKIGQSIQQTKSEAENLAASTGEYRYLCTGTGYCSMKTISAKDTAALASSEAQKAKSALDHTVNQAQQAADHTKRQVDGAVSQANAAVQNTKSTAASIAENSQRVINYILEIYE